MPPEKKHEDEYDKKRRLQGYYYRSIIPTYSRATGVDETTARYELQRKFLRCGEITTDNSGEFDVVWLEGDMIEAFEQGKRYIVRSVGDLSVPELSNLVDSAKDYILMRHGTHCPEFIREFKTKEI